MSHVARRYLIPLVLLGLTGAAAYGIRRGHTHASSSEFGLDSLPLDLAGFVGRDLPHNDSVFEELGADEMLERLYVAPEGSPAVKLSVVFSRGWRALHSPRACYKNQGWRVVEDTGSDSPPSNGKGGPIHATHLLMTHETHGRIAAIYVFVTGQASTGSWFRHSIRMGLGGSRRGGALIVAVVPSLSAQDDAAAMTAAEKIAIGAAEHLRERWAVEGTSGIDSGS